MVIWNRCRANSRQVVDIRIEPARGRRVRRQIYYPRNRHLASYIIHAQVKPEIPERGYLAPFDYDISGNNHVKRTVVNIDSILPRFSYCVPNYNAVIALLNPYPIPRAALNGVIRNDKVIAMVKLDAICG